MAEKYIPGFLTNIKSEARKFMVKHPEVSTREAIISSLTFARAKTARELKVSDISEDQRFGYLKELWNDADGDAERQYQLIIKKKSREEI